MGAKMKAATAAGISLLAMQSMTAHAQDTTARVNNPAPATDPTLESGRENDIVVTAQKQEQRLLEVPVPVSVLNSQNLVQSNLTRLQDYYQRIPSLTLTPGNQSAQILSIRGVNSGIGSPTVGITVDDVPFGSSTFIGGGNVVPDIDPGLLSRIEVLRGPQGTLYGASSMGGLLKFVTRDPSQSATSGTVRGGVSAVDGGGSLGYEARGFLNVPLGSDFAISLSGLRRNEPGYVDNIQSGQRDVNERNTSAGHLSALWSISSNVRLKVLALYQRSQGDGSSSVDPLLGDLKQSRLIDSGTFVRKQQLYSANLTATLGKAELTSVTGYGINEFHDSLDFPALSSAVLTNFGVTGSDLLSDNRTKKFSQELRLNVPFNDTLSGLFGGFYTNEDTAYTQRVVGRNSTTGVTAGRYLFNLFPTTFREIAAFGNVTWKPFDRFELQVGGRQSFIRQTFQQSSTVLATAPALIPETATKSNAFTFLVTPKYQISRDFMVYGRMSSGYRAGGVNAITPGVNYGITVPPGYDPDRTIEYSAGLKGSFLSGALTIDASLYRIDWRKIQITVRAPNNSVSYTVNGATARSQGVEVSADLHPVKKLTLGGYVALNDAKLTEALPDCRGLCAPDNARLPYSSRFSANAYAEQEFDLGKDSSGFLRANVAYTGRRVDRFVAGTPVRNQLPSYTKLDVSAGIRSGPWSLAASVNNLTNRRGIIAIGANGPATSRTYITPRTFALSVARDF